MIVGAGVNGIGTFRDLVLQGVDVLLVDKYDFCSGASSASSHMVHGGIRYLENGEFRLVREAVQERNRLIENAPHQVFPLPTVFPVFKWFSGILNAPLKFLGLMNQPSERGAIVIKIGMSLYDKYASAQGTVPKHRIIGRKQALEMFPHLNPRIKMAGIYFDGTMPSPERICMELIHDGREAGEHAQVLNYCGLVGVEGEIVKLKDEVSGEVIEVKPKLLINAAGPWIDIANQKLGQQTRYIGGTKGSHIVLDNPALSREIQDYEIFFENKDGYIVHVFPLLDKVIVGTSDIRVDNPDNVFCTEEEIEYFFEMFEVVFPTMEIRRDQIIYQISGVRPLPYKPEGFTGMISRDHHMEVDELGAYPVYSLIGGKWTSFRAFSEQVADKALAFLKKERQISTRSLPIGGGADYPKDDTSRNSYLHGLMEKFGLSEGQAVWLFTRYGTLAGEVSEYLAQAPDKDLQAVPGFSRREVAYLVTHEDVQHLDDFVLRRTMLAILGQLSLEGLHELAEVIAEVRSWPPDRTKFEIERCLQILRRHHGMQI